MSKRVRWGTEFEQDDCYRLVNDVGDDVARTLDIYGWMIVMKPENRIGNPNDDAWPMINEVVNVPDWAMPAPLRGPMLVYSRDDDGSDPPEAA